MVATSAQVKMERSVPELAQMMRRGRGAASTLVEERSQTAEAKVALNAFLIVDSDGALSKARRNDAVVAKGDGPRLVAGVPLVAKDNINVTIAASTDAIWLRRCPESVSNGHQLPISARCGHRGGS